MVAKEKLNLTRIVAVDLWQHKWVLLLALVVIANGALVVYTSYINRQYTSQWDLQLQRRDQLDIEWRNLLLEELSQSEHSRVSQIATKKLHMIRPLPSQEVIVRVP